jgi:hypothetical protein
MPIKVSESFEQAAFVKDTKAKRPGLLFHAVPNGGLRDRVTGARLKREGALAGVPDLFFPNARGGYFGYYMEMKTAKGRLSEPQKIIIPMLESLGYKVDVCRGFNEAVHALDCYLALEETK